MFDMGGAFAFSARTKAAMDAHTTAVIRIPVGLLLIIALVYPAGSMENVIEVERVLLLPFFFLGWAQSLCS